MDQQPNNNVPPITPPPVQPTPLAQPPADPNTGSVPPVMMPPQGPQQPKSKTGLIVGLVIGGIIALIVILLIVVGLMANKADDNKKATNTNQNTTSKSSSDESNSNNAETAKYSSDFEAVCQGGSISNAASFAKGTKPYKVFAFFNNSAGYSDNWTTVYLSSQQSSTANSDNVTEANVVACLAEKKGTAAKSQTCEFESGGEKVTLDYYSLKYALEFREAKTGKVLGTGSDINGPATKCPSFVSYDKNDPKVYADPDEDAVQAAVKAFAE